MKKVLKEIKDRKKQLELEIAEKITAFQMLHECKVDGSIENKYITSHANGEDVYKVEVSLTIEI